ncbi:MAG: EAL domain-containing protein [Halofilum sp. (in: g-proteobacteria)]|nr:EAL domain-containing protein [Halofilum sp. (in: g-proteobacteria)]
MLPGRILRPLAVAGFAGAVAVAAISVAAAGPDAGSRVAIAALLAAGAAGGAFWVVARRARAQLDERARRLLAVAERTAGPLTASGGHERLDAFARVARSLHALARRAQTAHLEFLEAERRFRALADGSVQGVLIERDWKPLYANDALATLLGLDCAETVEQLPSLEPFVARADRRRLRQHADDRAAGRDVTEQYEFAAIRRGGDIALIEARARSVEWRGRIATQHTMMDITARRRAEHALREREQQIRAIFDYSPAEMLIKDNDGRYVFVSRRFERVLGVSNAEARGKLPHELYPAERADAIRAHDLEVLESGRVIEREEQIELPDGEHTVLTVKFPIPDTSGNPVGIGAMMTDLTERRSTEAALRASETRFRDFAETAADWFWEMDAAHHFTYLSERFQEVTGVDPDTVLGCSLQEAFADHIAEIDGQASGTSALAGSQAFEVELHFSKAPDQRRVFHLSGKPVHDDNGTFTGYRGTGRDITEARRLSEQLSFQAAHDPLTGLCNRREFETRLERAVTGASEHGTEHALCYLDLDQFKVINDTSGHVAGDELLRQLGMLLSGHLRSRDTLARLGGDEFGVLLEHCSVDQAWAIANTIREAIEEFRFAWESKTFSIGVSVGLVPVSGQGESISTLMSAADSACYAAKEQGRNRIQVYHEEDSQLARRYGEMAWVSRIQHALDDDRFELAFQPIVALAADADEPPHYEMLVRLREDSGELVLPGAFLAAAERFSLAVGIDRWVVDNAFRWFAERARRRQDPMLCSINLSGHSLSDEGFLDYVIAQFDELLIDPSQVCFEVTETAAISNLASATRFINVLKEVGCLFSLDDFGSGLSSFAYLKSLPVDFVKIDGLFVRDIVDDPLDLALVRSINEIGHTMGKRTIAEFAETPGVLEKLREIGVDYAQGYSLGMPQLLTDIDSQPRATQRS